MTLYPLDSVRNSVPSGAIDIVLEDVREHLLRLPDTSFKGVHRQDAVDAFDIARARLNVTAAQLQDLTGSRGADISTGLGLLPPVLRGLGLDVLATRHEPDEPFVHVHVEEEPTAYSLGGALPARPDSLAWLTFTEVLEHVKIPPGQMIAHLASLLRPGGRLVLSTPNIARLSHLEALAAGESFLEPFDEGLPGGVDPTDHIEHVREYSIREVVEAVENAGLGVDRVVMTGWGDAGYRPLPNPYANEIMVLVATK